MARYLTDEQKAFYDQLEKSLDQFPGFTALPDKAHWDRYKPLFHLCRAKHVLTPDADDNWICVYDDQAEYVMALPREICPEGIVTIDQVKRKQDKALQRLKRKAREAATEYGEFEVRKEQGRIFLRHIGAVPV
jgi:hypothetical protein